MSNDKTPKPASPNETPVIAPVRKLKEGWVSKLEVLIAGRENRDEWIDDSVTAGTSVDTLFIQTVQGLVTFKVRADTSCKAAYELLQQANLPDTKLEVVSGPRGGLRLGVNGKFNPKLNIMVKK
jgi:hypothetical protein